eukprot:SAG31_NODE_13781_length_847_cov_1.151070_1_plen_166_part_10
MQEDYGFFGFDHLPQTCLTVFAQIALDGGFHDLPYLIQKTDAGVTGVIWWLFASIVIIVNLLVLNLFVAIVVSSFQSTHAAAAHTNAEQEQAAAVLNASLGDSPKQTNRHIDNLLEGLEDDVPDYLPGRRAKVERFLATSGFELSVLTVIGLNVIVLCSYHHGASK